MYNLDEFKRAMDKLFEEIKKEICPEYELVCEYFGE